MDDGEVCNKEDQKSNNDENSEDKFTPPSRQDASAEPHILAETTTSEDMDEKSRELFDNKVTFASLNLIYFSRLAISLTDYNIFLVKLNRYH